MIFLLSNSSLSFAFLKSLIFSDFKKSYFFNIGQPETKLQGFQVVDLTKKFKKLFIRLSM